VKQILADVSAQYRDRYNLSTQQFADLQTAQHFLEALRYLHMMLGEQTEADNLKKQYDLFEIKIDSELKKAATSG
jgi:hypothetical protein